MPCIQILQCCFCQNYFKLDTCSYEEYCHVFHKALCGSITEIVSFNHIAEVSAGLLQSYCLLGNGGSYCNIITKSIISSRAAWATWTITGQCVYTLRLYLPSFRWKIILHGEQFRNSVKLCFHGICLSHWLPNCFQIHGFSFSWVGYAVLIPIFDAYTICLASENPFLLASVSLIYFCFKISGIACYSRSSLYLAFLPSN